MKNTKKVFALVLILVIVLSTVAFALPQRPVMGRCESCGGVMRLVGTYYGSWEVEGRNGTMYVCSRTVRETYECYSCYRYDTLEFKEVEYFRPDELPVLPWD